MYLYLHLKQCYNRVTKLYYASVNADRTIWIVIIVTVYGLTYGMAYALSIDLTAAVHLVALVLTLGVSYVHVVHTIRVGYVKVRSAVLEGRHCKVTVGVWIYIAAMVSMIVLILDGMRG